MTKMQELAKLAQRGSGTALAIGRLAKEMLGDGYTVVEMLAPTGLSKRAIYQAIQVAEYAEEAGLSDRVVQAVGFTRMLVLADNVTPSKAKDWVLKAQALTVAQLKAMFEERGEQQMVFWLDDQQFGVLEAWLLKYGANKRGRGLANKENALMSLLSELQGLSPLQLIAQGER